MMWWLLILICSAVVLTAFDWSRLLYGDHKERMKESEAVADEKRKYIQTQLFDKF